MSERVTSHLAALATTFATTAVFVLASVVLAAIPLSFERPAPPADPVVAPVPVAIESSRAGELHEQCVHCP